MKRILCGLFFSAILLWPQDQTSLPSKEWQTALNHAFSKAKDGNIQEVHFLSSYNPSTPPQRLICITLYDSRHVAELDNRRKEIASLKGISRKEFYRLQKEMSDAFLKKLSIDAVLFHENGEILFKGTYEGARERLIVPKEKVWLYRQGSEITRHCLYWITFGPKSKHIKQEGHIRMIDDREPTKTNFDILRNLEKYHPYASDWKLHEGAMQAFGWFINHPLHRPVQSLKFFKKSEQLFLTLIVFPDGSSRWLHLNFETNPRDPVEVQVPDDQIQLNGGDGLRYQKEKYGLFLALE